MLRVQRGVVSVYRLKRVMMITGIVLVDVKQDINRPFATNVSCENKTYGENCREQCGRCDNSAAACDVFNGSCLACEKNFDLPLCTECVDGYFGDDCQHKCGQCAGNLVCNKTTGHCPGVCQPGYEHPTCEHECQNKTYGENCTEWCGRCENSAACDVFNGSCQACQGNYSLPLCK
ncbi:scavenger receptor class F member 2-like, partial [Littorina saxatilis]|uniref:scavenger receptor class F member 2-like n=1 Tax=Littorina saxatilis TaxID=31220 RepID=UPI0038B4400F